MTDRAESLRKAEETMRRLQHEVRTPIGQIVGYAELLEEELEERGHDELVPDLHRIREAAQRLLDLVDGKLRDERDPGAPPLPAEEAAAASGPEAEPIPVTARDRAARPRVLVIDGHADSRELLARRLAIHGFDVERAHDGLEGLRRIEEGGFDLVLVEILMPRMSGLEVLERVRRKFSRAELPIIVATALKDSEDIVEALERGANDYVTKPFDFPVVVARARKELETHRTAREVAALAKQLEFRSAFIRQALGRDVSDDLLVALAERPGAVDMGSELRRISVVVADVRGTRERESGMSPTQRATWLKYALDGLSNVAEHYDGLVEAVNGDSIVLLFGLPLPREDDADRAVACAIAMQLEVDAINERTARAELPTIEIGVGVATGDVVVVGFGAGEQIRYKAVGDPAPRATAIEAAARGGEVWVCGRTREAVGEALHIDGEREVPVLSEPERIHRAVGVGGSQLISLRRVPAL